MRRRKARLRLQCRTPRDSPRDKNQVPGGANLAGLDKLFACAAQQVRGWTTISLRLPDARQETLTFSIDQANGDRPDLRSQLTLNPSTGAVVRWELFSSYNRGRQLRSWARFTHTGEAFGLLGQTIAAIATAGAAVLVLTGLTLAWRRLGAWKSSAARDEAEEPSAARS
jgi:uncharacterized iron-regulated membrane protein